MGGGLLIMQMNSARRRREGNYGGPSGPDMEPKDWLCLILFVISIFAILITILEIGTYCFTGHFHIFNKIIQTFKHHCIQKTANQPIRPCQVQLIYLVQSHIQAEEF